MYDRRAEYWLIRNAGKGNQIVLADLQRSKGAEYWLICKQEGRRILADLYIGKQANIAMSKCQHQQRG
jgi:hypothetical protein